VSVGCDWPFTRNAQASHEQVDADVCCPPPLSRFLVFHGGSGSSAQEITTAVDNGVVKMNVDTDAQWAYMTGMRDFFSEKADYLKTQVGNSEASL